VVSPPFLLEIEMNSSGLLKHATAALGIAAVIYVVAYTGIEHRRARRGPWQIVFSNDSSGTPLLLINQPSLAIRNVRIAFPGEAAATPATVALALRDPRPVPYEVPFGKCLFMDTTFLPGTIVFELFGHEIQLLPRVLTIDKQEQPWRSETTIALPRKPSAAVLFRSESGHRTPFQASAAGF
jgi:hypothetical protein